jgi:lipoyl synthase
MTKTDFSHTLFRPSLLIKIGILYMVNQPNGKRKITLHFPTETLPVSVTGHSCALSCKHCGGAYLKSMKPASEIDLSNIPNSTKSFLISGGCDRGGTVPISRFADLMRRMKSLGYNLNVHSGVPGEEEYKLITALAQVVSFDFITDDETIKEVYGMDLTREDYVNAYKRLVEIVPVIPHVTIGLPGGRPGKELEAIEILAELNAIQMDRRDAYPTVGPASSRTNRIERPAHPTVVFIIFIPTRGTFYEKFPPPSLDYVEKIFSQAARRIMPEASLGLGCMHPRGQYKYSLETLGFKYGFDSFVNPSRRFQKFLENEWVEIVVNKECCAL